MVYYKELTKRQIPITDKDACYRVLERFQLSLKFGTLIGNGYITIN